MVEQIKSEPNFNIKIVQEKMPSSTLTMEVIELFKLLIIDLQLCVIHKKTQVGFEIQFKLIEKLKIQ